jgi:hypothetical protein
MKFLEILGVILSYTELIFFQVEKGGDDLQVFFLTRNGRVFIYQDNRHQTSATFSVFNASK